MVIVFKNLSFISKFKICKKKKKNYQLIESRIHICRKIIIF